jgi:hypothetical protein
MQSGLFLPAPVGNTFRGSLHIRMFAAAFHPKVKLFDPIRFVFFLRYIEKIVFSVVSDPFFWKGYAPSPIVHHLSIRVISFDLN